MENILCVCGYTRGKLLGKLLNERQEFASTDVSTAQRLPVSRLSLESLSPKGIHTYALMTHLYFSFHNLLFL